MGLTRAMTMWAKTMGGDDDRDDEHYNGDDKDDMVGPRITIQNLVAYES